MADASYTFEVQADDEASDDLERVEKSVDDLGDEAQDTAEKTETFGSRIGEVMAGDLMSEAVQKAGEMAVRLAEMQTQFVENTAAIDRNASSVGASVEQYQALQFAFERAGVGSDELQEALGTISERAEKAKLGAKGMIEDFGALNVTVGDLKGKNPGQLFRLVARRIGEAESDTKALQGATALLGDNIASKLTPRLRENANFFDEMADRAKETGNVLGQDAVDDAEKAQKAWRNLQDQVGGLKSAVMADLSPALEGFSNALGANIEDLREHREQMGRNAESARQTGRAWGSAAGQGAKFADTLSPIAGFLGDVTGESIRMLDGATRLTSGLAGLREGFSGNNEAAQAYIDRLQKMGKSQAQIATSWNDFKTVTAAQQGRFDVLAEDAEELQGVQRELVETINEHGVESEETNRVLERARKKMDQMEPATSRWGQSVGRVTGRLRQLGKEAANLPSQLVDLTGMLPGADGGGDGGDEDDGPSDEELKQRARKRREAEKELEVMQAQNDVERARVKLEQTREEIQRKGLTGARKEVKLLEAEQNLRSAKQEKVEATLEKIDKEAQKHAQIPHHIREQTKALNERRDAVKSMEVGVPDGGADPNGGMPVTEGVGIDTLRDRLDDPTLSDAERKDLKNALERRQQPIRETGRALQRTGRGMGRSASEAAGLIGQAGQRSQKRGRREIQRLQQQRQQASSKAQRRALEKQIQQKRKSLKLDRRQNRVLQQKIKAYGKLTGTVGELSGSIAKLAEKSFDFSDAQESAASATSALSSAGGAAAQILGKSVQQQAGIKAGFETAASVAAFAAYAASQGTAPQLLAAGIQHGTAAGMFGSIAAGAGTQGGGGSRPSAAGGGGGGGGGNPSPAANFDPDKQREKSAQAFAEKLKSEREMRPIVNRVDFGNSTQLQDAPKVWDEIKEGMRQLARNQSRAGKGFLE